MVYAIRNIFWVPILNNLQYYLEINSSKIVSIFGRSILLILSSTQNFSWSIPLIILSNTKKSRGIDNPHSKRYAVFSAVDTFYTKQNDTAYMEEHAALSCRRYFTPSKALYFGWWILILSNSQHFPTVETPCADQHTLFPEGRYFFYSAKRSIFARSILLTPIIAQYFCWSILLMFNSTQYSRGVDTFNTKQNAVFSGDPCFIYKGIPSIFAEATLLILSNTQH